ncbi:hypothetical protein TNCV_1923961 [Trichonephila clavipes]|nr:hypothetical protein TNCV_1923961 [Trichonephila clavipes]
MGGGHAIARWTRVRDWLILPVRSLDGRLLLAALRRELETITPAIEVQHPEFRAKGARYKTLSTLHGIHTALLMAIRVTSPHNDRILFRKGGGGYDGHAVNLVLMTFSFPRPGLDHLQGWVVTVAKESRSRIHGRLSRVTGSCSGVEKDRYLEWMMHVKPVQAQSSYAGMDRTQQSSREGETGERVHWSPKRWPQSAADVECHLRHRPRTPGTRAPTTLLLHQRHLRHPQPLCTSTT